MARRKDSTFDYPDNFSTCRALVGHAWDISETYRTTAGEFIYRSTCSRCGTAKIATYSKWGDLKKTIYHHPISYKIKGGVERKVLRVQLFKRVGK